MAGTAGPLYAPAYWLLGLRTAALEILACSACMLLAPGALCALGCDAAQGYLFARPQAAAALHACTQD